MKKFLAVIFTVCLFTNTAFASAQYDEAIAKLKSEKSAKLKVINTQIKETESKIATVTYSQNLSESQRASKFAAYEKQLAALKLKKHQIKEKYKEDKKRLKNLK